MNPTSGPAPVLVIGAGPVGLTLASELIRHGTSVRIVDQNHAHVAGASRAIAVQARTLEVFTDMGIVEAVLAAGHRVHGASIYAENKRIIHLDFDELESPYRFVIDLAQSQTERILTSHLEALGVDVERRTTLAGFAQDAEGVSVSLRREDGSAEEFRASYLVGCDGAGSTVRHTLGLAFDGDSPQETFLLADVHLDWSQPDDEWVLWFHEDGLLSVFPLPDGLWRVIADGAGAEASAEELNRIWNARAPVQAKPRDPLWISYYRVERRRASEYQRGRVFIAGDAAHVYGPAGGQGMNTGIQDAYNLAWKLALVLKGKSAASLLESYTAEREPVSRSVLALIGQMKALATMRHPVSQGIRNRIIPMLAELEVIEQRVISRVGETSVNYRSSPIVGQQGRWWATSPSPGDRAPAIGDLLEGTRFKVLMFTGDQASEQTLEEFATVERYMREGYADDVDPWLISREEMDWPSGMRHDESSLIHKRYGAGVPCIYVIRPDNYIGFRSLGTEALPVLEYLGTIFESEPKA